MIHTEGFDGSRSQAGAPCRRALDVFDDYDGGGVLSEQLADDLVNELVGLGPRARPSRSRRGTDPATRTGPHLSGPHHAGPRPTGPHPTGPQPSRPSSGAQSASSGSRPRLTLVRGGAWAPVDPERQSFTAASTT